MSATAMPDSRKTASKVTDMITPHLRQNAREIQRFGTVIPDLPIGLDTKAREKVCAFLNLLLADTMCLRDLYKKAHWQIGGPTFYQLHLLLDKHFGEQSELVDLIAERIQMLGGVSVATAHDVAEIARVKRAPRGREEAPVMIARLLEVHEMILMDARSRAREASELGDEGTNDLLVSNLVRTNEMQVWFMSEHLVDMPLTDAH
jgi:starvation-inducible DNA-binding protein